MEKPIDNQFFIQWVHDKISHLCYTIILKFFVFRQKCFSKEEVSDPFGDVVVVLDGHPAKEGLVPEFDQEIYHQFFIGFCEWLRIIVLFLIVWVFFWNDLIYLLIARFNLQ